MNAPKQKDTSVRAHKELTLSKNQCSAPKKVNPTVGRKSSSPASHCMVCLEQWEGRLTPLKTIDFKKALASGAVCTQNGATKSTLSRSEQPAMSERVLPLLSQSSFEKRLSLPTALFLMNVCLDDPHPHFSLNKHHPYDNANIATKYAWADIH